MEDEYRKGQIDLFNRIYSKFEEADKALTTLEVDTESKMLGIAGAVFRELNKIRDELGVTEE